MQCVLDTCMSKWMRGQSMGWADLLTRIELNAAGFGIWTPRLEFGIHREFRSSGLGIGDSDLEISLKSVSGNNRLFLLKRSKH